MPSPPKPTARSLPIRTKPTSKSARERTRQATTISASEAPPTEAGSEITTPLSNPPLPGRQTTQTLPPPSDPQNVQTLPPLLETLTSTTHQLPSQPPPTDRTLTLTGPLTFHLPTTARGEMQLLPSQHHVPLPSGTQVITFTGPVTFILQPHPSSATTSASASTSALSAPAILGTQAQDIAHSNAQRIKERRRKHREKRRELKERRHQLRKEGKLSEKEEYRMAVEEWEDAMEEWEERIKGKGKSEEGGEEGVN